MGREQIVPSDEEARFFFSGSVMEAIKAANDSRKDIIIWMQIENDRSQNDVRMKLVSLDVSEQISQKAICLKIFYSSHDGTTFRKKFPLKVSSTPAIIIIDPTQMKLISRHEKTTLDENNVMNICSDLSLGEEIESDEDERVEEETSDPQLKPEEKEEKTEPFPENEEEEITEEEEGEKIEEISEEEAESEEEEPTPEDKKAQLKRVLDRLRKRREKEEKEEEQMKELNRRAVGKDLHNARERHSVIRRRVEKEEREKEKKKKKEHEKKVKKQIRDDKIRRKNKRLREIQQREQQKKQEQDKKEKEKEKRKKVEKEIPQPQKTTKKKKSKKKKKKMKKSREKEVEEEEEPLTPTFLNQFTKTNIVFKLSNGSHLKKEFGADDNIDTLYQYVCDEFGVTGKTITCEDESESDELKMGDSIFRLVVYDIPKREIFIEKDHNKSLKQFRLVPSGTIWLMKKRTYSSTSSGIGGGGVGYILGLLWSVLIFIFNVITWPFQGWFGGEEQETHPPKPNKKKKKPKKNWNGNGTVFEDQFVEE